MAAPQTSGTPAPNGAAPAQPAAGAAASPAEPETFNGFEDAGALAEAMKALEGVSGVDEPETMARPAGEPSEPQAPAEESTTDPADPTKEKPRPQTEEEFSKAFAALTHQERRLKTKVSEFHQERDAYKAERESWEKQRQTADQEWAGRKERARREPLVALQELGWTLPQLVKYVGENGTIPQEKILEDLRLEHTEGLKKLAEEQKTLREQLDSERKEAMRLQAQRQISEYETNLANEVAATAKAYADRFPTLARALGTKLGPAAQQRVLSVLVDHARDNADAIKAGLKNPLALTDAMFYAEKELAELAGVFASPDAGQAGAKQPEAGKPERSPLGSATSGIGSGAGLEPAADDLSEEELFARAMRELNAQ